jgi:hypothetical protein
VEAQHLVSTRRLVDSLAEQEILEELLEAAKPALPREPEFRGLHFLLATPFRYPPLRHGSRFGTRSERALWYGAERVETALAEVAYYRLLFLEGTAADLAPVEVALSAFRARVRTDRGVDLTAPPFSAYRARISSPSRYDASQRLGAEMRADGVEAIRFASARDPAHAPAVGVFTPAAFASKRPVGPAETWHCTVTAERDVELVRRDPVDVRRFRFARGIFLVRGRLPAPAV